MNTYVNFLENENVNQQPWSDNFCSLEQFFFIAIISYFDAVKGDKNQLIMLEIKELLRISKMAKPDQ